MLEIINDVLQSEESAEKILREARDEAARTRSEFSEVESRELRERGALADQRLREGLSALREAEERRRHEAEERLRKEESDFAASDPEGLGEAVELSVRMIIGGPRPADEAGGEGGGA